MIPLLVFCVACSPKITYQAMQKQEAKATEQLKSAREEMIELAEMKEKYSVDSRDMQIKALEKEQKQMKKDIKSLGSVQSESAIDASGEISGNLQTKQKGIADKISRLKATNQENWSSLRDSINQQTQRLQSQINRITANMENEKKN